MLSRVSSTIRHLRRADRLFSSFSITMRPCQSCVSRGLFCVISELSEHCEQCFRNKRSCELAPPDAKMERLFRQKKDLFDKAMEAKAKATRFAKQHCLMVRKLRELDRREEQNILELEIDKIMADRVMKMEGASATGPPLESFPNLPPFNPSQVSQGSANRTPVSPFRSG